MQFTNFPTLFKLSKNEQKTAIESLIFSSDEPLNSNQIVNMLISIEVNFQDENENEGSNTYNINIDDNPLLAPIEYIENLISEINDDLANSTRPYRIIKIADTWQFAILSEYGKLINTHFKIKNKKKLSQAALETLAIISYRQPISKPEIEQIRGVNSNEVVNSLMEKNLIKIAGRSESLGKPLLYATTQEFLRVFGLNSLNELPKIKEIEELVSNEKPEIDNISENIEIFIDTNLETFQNN